MRLALALFFALTLALSAAEKQQFNRVPPAGLTPIQDTNIVIAHSGNQTIPGPSAVAAMSASATINGSTNGLVINWSYTSASGSLTLETLTGPTNLATFSAQGQYTFKANANVGVYYNEATFDIFINDQGITNFLPTVDMDRPPNGTTFVSPIDLVISANASDKDGTVTNVSFYSGSVLIGSVTSEPFQIILTNAAAGDYVITAVVTDNRGATNVSSGHTVTVESGVVVPVPPMVFITSPTNGSTFTGPVTFAFTAIASDPDGTVSSITFTDNGVTNAVDASSPYSVSITPPEGGHTLRAVVTDNDGLQSSTTVSITVIGPPLPPVATLTGPTNGTVLTAPATLSMTATASDPDGTITQVRFFVNGVQSGTDSSSPYAASLSNVGVGTYQIYAQAVDNTSAVGTSATNTVIVNAPPGVPPSITLTSPTDSQVFLDGATVTLAASATDDGTITNVSFYVLTPEEPEDQVFTTVNDDETGVVYSASWTDNNSALNRNNDDEHYSQTTGASATFSFTGNEVSWFCTKFSNRGNADIFIDNVLQTTIDQYSATVLYQQKLFTSTGLTNGPHTVKVVCKGTKQAASTGVFVDVDFFEYSSLTEAVPASETLIASDTTSPYSQNWIPAIGSYSIRARAWDNLGLITTSAPPVMILVNPAFPPFVQLTSPTNDQVFALGAPVALTASATDQDGTVISVNFRQYIPDTSISTDASSPYTGSWTNAPSGASSLIAAATDNDGLVSFSAVVNITVTSTNQVNVNAGVNQTSQLSVYKPYFDAQYVTHAGTFNGTAATGNGQAMYDMQFILESTAAMYEATLETNYINRALLWSETLISKATIFDTDGKRNWSGLWASPHSTTNIAYVSEEGRGAVGMLRVCRIILSDTRLRSIWGTRATTVYNFLRDNVVVKNWFTRANWGAWFVNKYNNPDSGQNTRELTMARLLYNCKTISSLLANSDNATYGFPNLVNQAAGGIKDYNGREACFTPWTSGSLVFKRGKLFESPHYILDTSHAGQLANTVYDLYKGGTVIDSTILQGVCTLFSKVIWTQSVSNPQFNNFIDGANGYFRTYGPYRSGAIHHGWAQLGEFDTNCLAAAQAMLRFIVNGGNNPSEDYNNTYWGRSGLAGNLANCVSATGPKPYATLNGVVTGAGVTSTTWSRVSGSGTATIVTPTNATTVVLFGTNAIGSSTFRLTVTSSGPQVSDDVTVTLLAAPSL